MRWLSWMVAVWVVGCASNPPLDRDRPRGQPQIAMDWEDAGPGRRAAPDAGPGRALDAGAPDAGGPDAGGPDAGPADLDCAALTGMGLEVCAGFAEACEVIFRDGRGCRAACEGAGLVCEDSWNDESGQCAPRRSQHYGCRESGHDSDYCVCVRAS